MDGVTVLAVEMEGVAELVLLALPLNRPLFKFPVFMSGGPFA